MKVQGHFLDEALPVQRVQDARMGALVVRPFKTDQNFTIFVNCGWIPEELTDTIPAVEKGHKEIIGLVKLDENKEIKRTNYMYPMNDKVHNLIDLEHF